MGIARSRYNFIAPLYDPLMGLFETSRFVEWRKLLWSKVEGHRILLVGVGTGRDFPYFPPDRDIVAIDVSENMLQRARRKAQSSMLKVDLRVMDVQHLEFKDDSFDSVISSLVFCSVTDPLKGLAEIRRVLKTGGCAKLFEHVLSDDPGLARLLHILNPVSNFLLGESFDRDTVRNVIRSGLILEEVICLDSIFRIIQAHKSQPQT